MAWFVLALMSLWCSLFATQWASNPTWQLVISAVLVSLAFAAIALGGAALSPGSASRRLGWVPSGLSPGVLAGLVVGMLSLSQALELIIRWMGLSEVGNLAEFDRILAGLQGRELVGSILGIALLPGLCEELVFRGLLQRGLQRRAGPVWAVLISSLIFGIVHGEAIHASAASVLGLYLGTLTVLTGSIRPAVLCHILNNALATIGSAANIEAIGVVPVTLGGLVGAWALARVWQEARPPAGREDADPAPAASGD